MSVTNTLAYYEHPKITDVKSFITFGPGCHARCPGQQPADVLTLPDDPTTAAASAAASTATATTATAATTATNRRVYPTEAPVHSRVITNTFYREPLLKGKTIQLTSLL